MPRNVGSRASMHSLMTNALDDKVNYFNTNSMALGDKVWIPTSDKKDWEYGKVLEIDTHEVDAVFVERINNPKEKAYIGRQVFPADKTFKDDGHADMTSMKYINEPQILKNLEVRSLAEEPYTFMGPVLVAVNPLKELDAPFHAGDPKCRRATHPYAIAELALGQMQFTLQRPEENVATPADQTVIVSGESGSGKTVSSRLLLDHLVKRSGGGDALAKAMLGSNPILESFGNATTLRNPNSSRFGKLMKLHFDAKGKSILGASIVTYLLERSRITSHELGERGYHIFYELLAGADKKTLESLSLDKKTLYKALLPRGAEVLDIKAVALIKDDEKNFKTTTAALESVGVSKDEQANIFKILAAIVHMGQLELEEVEEQDGNVAKISEAGKAALANVAALLSIDAATFETTITTREIGTEKIVKRLNLKESKKNVDGMMKAVYSTLFLYVVSAVNRSIVGKSVEDQPVMGVLDIFGFETFAKNDFEQLLINYTNEALQQVFNKQVLEREADLYKAEGLSMSVEDKMALDPSIVHDAKNAKCILLFEGHSIKTEKGVMRKLGILDYIHNEGNELKPNDKKMLQRINAAFAKKEYKRVFGKGKKKDKDRRFRIRHYASTVQYTVGNFVEKNNQSLPKAVNEMFASSTSEFVKAVWDCGDFPPSNKRNAASIVSKFAKQIRSLVDHLQSTQCSFIRCIKPNPRLELGTGWFNRPYVMRQVKNLSIGKTADILKSGLPTRIPYDQLVGQYKSIFEKEKMPKFYTSTEDDSALKTFVGALFFAFDIERSSYKLGLTRVFFKTGELEKLESVLSSADKWASGSMSAEETKEKDGIVNLFKLYHMRRRWGAFFATMLATRHFTTLLQKVRKRNEDELAAAINIQRVVRGHLARQVARKLLQAKIEAERAAAEKKRKEEEEKRLREQAERARQAEEDERKLKRQLAEAKAIQQLREKKWAQMRAMMKAVDERVKRENARIKAKEEREAAEAKELEAQKKREAEIQAEYDQLQAIEAQKKAFTAGLEAAKAKKLEEEAKLEAARKEKEDREAAEFLANTKLLNQKLMERQKQFKDEQKKARAEQEEMRNEVIDIITDREALRSAMKEQERKDDDLSSDDESVASDAQPVTKEDDKFEEEEAELEKKAAVEAEEDDLGVNVTYKGPYLVQMNRFLLEKSARKGRGILPNRLKSHWIDCFAFVYPVERKMLIYHSIKESKKAKDGITWRFEVGNKHPVMTDITLHEQRANVVHLTDILEVPETASKDPIPVSGRGRELMIAFKTSPERKEFINHIKGWVLERKVTPANGKSQLDKPRRKSKRKSIFFHLKNAEVERNHRINRTLKFVQNALKSKGATKEQMVELVADQMRAEEEAEEEDDVNDDVLDYIIICTQCHKEGAQGTSYETSECTEVTLSQGMIIGKCPKTHTFRNTVDD